MRVKPSMRAAIDRYNAKFDDIKIRVPKGMRDAYKAHAHAKGTSLNALVVKLLEEDLQKTDIGLELNRPDR